MTELPALLALQVIGRVADSSWLQVVTPAGQTGWVAAQYLDVTIDVGALPITGEVENTQFPTQVRVVGPGDIDVVTGVTARSRQIFLAGRALGNLPNVFTYVGDSISASPFYLKPIGEGRYSLGEYGYLQGAINFFSGPTGRGDNPFRSASMAASNGWSTESVLSPTYAPNSICTPQENPVECEYRVVKPSVALIMLGTNDSGGLPTDKYAANLRRIVEISIRMGVIPVLSTIPPKHFDARTDGRVAEFNQIIIQTARSYDIPLWNYYGVMAVLPDDGLDADGVHPSPAPDWRHADFDAEHLKYGYVLRNLTALQVLYTLWQQVLYDGTTAPPATLPPDVIATLPVIDPPVVATSPPVDIGSYTCPGTLPVRLRVGMTARVTPGLPNKLRATPGNGGSQIGQIPGEAVFSVIGGPQCVDGFTWWQVDYNGQTGWTASGNADEYWVEPWQ